MSRVSANDPHSEAIAATSTLPAGLSIPKQTADVDGAYMTELLRYRGLIADDNEVVSLNAFDVGMTAGYFSQIKRIQCEYKYPTDLPTSFIVKTYPEFELLPKEHIHAMFVKDIKSYLFPQEQFYPRPQAYLAAFDLEKDACALVLEDANTYAEHKVHENEMSLSETMAMIPQLVDFAVAWEGCSDGKRAQQLDQIGVQLWTSDFNIGMLKTIMPAGAKFGDKILSMKDSALVELPTWDVCFGHADFTELFTRKIEAFFDAVRPERGATCTLSHGDLRGDNIFIRRNKEPGDTDWLCIDFQLLFRGPVPSDLAYLLTSASVLPEVYSSDNLNTILRAFYERFMAKTRLYTQYTYTQFENEFRIMSTVLFCYYVGFGGAIWREGAFRNQQAARVELGGQGVTEQDLAPAELRKRMWWRKAFRNFREMFKRYDLYNHLQTLPDTQGLGEWVELPDHLK